MYTDEELTAAMARMRQPKVKVAKKKPPMSAEQKETARKNREFKRYRDMMLIERAIANGLSPSDGEVVAYMKERKK